jgi:hypothetical protein
MSTAKKVGDQPSTTFTDKAVYQHMHAKNIAAHQAGRQAGKARQGTRSYPDNYNSDQAYWWLEGYFQRPFRPLTDDRALQAHRQEMLIEQARKTHTP